MSSKKKQKRLEKLELLTKRWANCKKCNLKDQRQNVVFWRGHPCAKIFLLGEAPGETEDIEGVPFVGASGKQLDLMLKDCGLRLKRDIFIANVLGCRPPNNANPEPEQVKKCRPRVERMIEIVKPKVIVLLGGSAALHMAGISKIGQWKGRKTSVQILKGDTVFDAVSTYHPSYYLRRGKNADLRKEITNHLKFAVEVANV